MKIAKWIQDSLPIRLFLILQSKWTLDLCRYFALSKIPSLLLLIMVGMHFTANKASDLNWIKVFWDMFQSSLSLIRSLTHLIKSQSDLQALLIKIIWYRCNNMEFTLSTIQCFWKHHYFHIVERSSWQLLLYNFAFCEFRWENLTLRLSHAMAPFLYRYIIMYNYPSESTEISLPQMEGAHVTTF